MKQIVKGTIFYAKLDPVIGSEQNGYRPVVVLQNDIGNKYSPTTIVAPISTKGYKEKRLPTHVNIRHFKKIRPNSIILTEQIRVIDKSRLKGFVDSLTKQEMNDLNKAISIAFGLNY